WGEGSSAATVAHGLLWSARQGLLLHEAGFAPSRALAGKGAARRGPCAKGSAGILMEQTKTVRYRWPNQDAKANPAALAEACAQWPDKIFLDFSGETHSFTEVDRAATRIAHGLRALGVARGDRVCSIMDNVADAIFVWFAINKLGAVSVPINTSFKG